ncbi:hypothetical protein IT411_00460 [Candidatus Peregrinibacteria bacterium]|nr:hypothetical protein [Candidatus Peregrinibacteria bacterium]
MTSIDKAKEGPIEFICGLLTRLSVFAKDAKNILTFKEKFDLPTLKDSLSTHLATPGFLSDQALSRIHGNYDSHREALRQNYPEGWTVTILGLPCLPTGSRLPNSCFDLEKNPGAHYLTAIYTDPFGRSYAHDGSYCAPFLKVIPEEIALECTFPIKYKAANPGDDTSDQDYEYLVSETKKVLGKFRELLLK